MGAEWQIQSTMYLPKNCTILDLQSLEANTVKDLIINQTRLETQKNKPSRDSIYSSTSRNDKNQQRREGKSWTKSPERRKSWDKKNQNDKYDDKKRTNYRQRSNSKDSNKTNDRFRDTSRGRNTDTRGKPRDSRDVDKNYRLTKYEI